MKVPWSSVTVGKPLAEGAAAARVAKPARIAVVMWDQRIVLSY